MLMPSSMLPTMLVAISTHRHNTQHTTHTHNPKLFLFSNPLVTIWAGTEKTPFKCYFIEQDDDEEGDGGPKDRNGKFSCLSVHQLFFFLMYYRQSKRWVIWIIVALSARLRWWWTITWTWSWTRGWSVTSNLRPLATSEGSLFIIEARTSRTF